MERTGFAHYYISCSVLQCLHGQIRFLVGRAGKPLRARHSAAVEKDVDIGGDFEAKKLDGGTRAKSCLNISKAVK